jgi:hypothetical protein
MRLIEPPSTRPILRDRVPDMTVQLGSFECVIRRSIAAVYNRSDPGIIREADCGMLTTTSPSRSSSSAAC